MNLIKKKPYIETPVYTSYDKSQGQEMWDIFQKRNTSRIVDLFYGMTSSEVSCSECHECRVRYDPNNAVMLPLPKEQLKVTINYLEARDLSQYNEEFETLRRKTLERKRAKEALTDEEQAVAKKPAFREKILHYWEYNYNFYGVNRDMYEFAAKQLEVEVEDIDLILMEKSEDDSMIDVAVYPIDINSPQSSLSQFEDSHTYIICLKVALFPFVHP